MTPQALAQSDDEALLKQGWRQCAVGQRTTQYCGMAEQARLEEREACAKVCDEIENDAYATYRKNYDSYAEGFSAGALACLEAIKARGEK